MMDFTIAGKSAPLKILAPMAGYTDIAFRSLAVQYGADYAVTEMVSVNGLNYGSEKTFELMRFADNERVKCVQLFGSDPDAFYNAIKSKLIEAFDIIDINMGCPMPKITKTGAGSALLLKPDIAARIVESAVKATRKPVTVKVRLGVNTGENVLGKLLPLLESAGCAMIEIHGRYSEQRYSGNCDVKAIADAAKLVRLPVIANGDITTKADIGMRLNIADNIAGVMIGRGALGNPSLFGDTACSIYDMLMQHLQLLQKYFDSRYCVISMRKHMPYYLRGVTGGKKLKELINNAQTVDEIVNAIELYRGIL